MKRVVYMGTPEYARVILEKLLDSDAIDVTLVLTQPDRPVGRKKVLTPPPVKVLAQESNVEVLQPETLRDEDTVNKIKSSKPDIIIVAAYGQLLPEEVLGIAPCVNLHASILPKYRGASPIQQAILNGDKYSGVTAMLMEEGLDTGDMLGFRYVKSDSYPTLEDMTKQLSAEAAVLTLSIVENFESLNPIPQLNAASSNCKKIKREDGLVTLDSASSLYRKYLAYYGWPGVFLDNGLKFFGVEIVDYSSKHNPGEVLDISKNGVKIACREGVVLVREFQPKSKSKMLAKAYLAGQRIGVGDNIL